MEHEGRQFAATVHVPGGTRIIRALPAPDRRAPRQVRRFRWSGPAGGDGEAGR